MPQKLFKLFRLVKTKWAIIKSNILFKYKKNNRSCSIVVTYHFFTLFGIRSTLHIDAGLSNVCMMVYATNV